MIIKICNKHMDAGIKLSTHDPMALAIKEELDKQPVPKGYLRVERVVSVTSAVLVVEHRVIKRKGREEIDLAFEKYWLGPKAEFDLHYKAFDFMVAYGFAPLVGGTSPDPEGVAFEFEITKDETK